MKLDGAATVVPYLFTMWRARFSTLSAIVIAGETIKFFGQYSLNIPEVTELLQRMVKPF